MIPRDIADKDALRLDIAAPYSWQYRPGDTIIGNVMRNSAILSPEAKLKVWLTGVMRVRILRNRGTHPNDLWGNDDSYIGKWNLLDFTEQIIFTGPLHHPENSGDSLSWSFSVPIPSKPKAYITQGHQAQASFISFEKDHQAFHVLPGSMRTRCDGYSSKSEALIEYSLHAQLEYERGGSRKTQYTTTPIMMKHATEAIGKVQTLTGGLSSPTKIRSHRLLPGMENKELSLREKTRKIFASSKPPELWFKVLVKSPPIVQFDNPTVLPITLGINTLKEEGHTSKIIEEIPQLIEIDYVKIRLKSWTTVIAPGNLGSRAHTDHQDFDVDFHFEDVLKNLEGPLVIYSSGKGNQPINLGSMFQLALRRDGLYSNGKRCSWTFTPTIFPDILTFAIKHTHQFEYRICLKVAGVKTEVKVFAPVKIIESD